MASETPADRVRAWKPGVPGIAEVFHARFASHAYPSHTHDTWTILLVDDGTVRYDLDPGSGSGTDYPRFVLPGIMATSVRTSSPTTVNTQDSANRAPPTPYR